MADKAEAVADDRSKETVKFVVTIEGNQNDWAKFTTETFLVAADGTEKEAGPKLSKDAENVLVALFDAGGVLQSLSLTAAVGMAARGGDIKTALDLLKTARGLGIQIASFSGLAEPAVA